MPATNNQVAQALRPTGQAVKSKTPKDVATPFPPLNLSQIEKLCPRTAAKPAIKLASIPQR